MIEVRKPRREELREAGELLGVEAVDRTGLVVTSEGAFVRIFRVAPVNPLLMSGEEREKAAGTFQRLISQLHADERIQVVVEGRPVNLDELRRRVPARGRGVRGAAAERETAVRAIRWRCRAGGCTRRSRSRCGCTPTARPRSRSTTTWWCRSCRASTSRAPRSRTGGGGSCRPRRSSAR